MKAQQFKLLLVLFCTGLLTANAQKLEKKYTEKFNVNKDVVIDVNTRYTDIEIETWDRNEVIIEAYIQIEEEVDKEAIEDYLEKWKFEALGNKSTVKISSKSSGLIDIHTFDFNAPDYNSQLFESLNNLEFVVPEMPEIPEVPELEFHFPDKFEIPEIPELPELPETPSKFDFDAYRKDKSYLERWKKENKDIIGKNANVRVGKNSISINSKDDNSTYKWRITTEGQNQLAKDLEERLEERKLYRAERQKEWQEQLKKRQKELKLRQEELKTRIKERSEERKLELIKRQEAHEKRAREMKERRVEIRDILKKREKQKIKRIIRIKAPKNAKFNMNVQYGSMSFPKG